MYIMEQNNYAVWDLINAEILNANTDNIEHTVFENRVTNIAMYNKVIEPFNTNVMTILQANDIEYSRFSYDMKGTTLRDKFYIFFTTPHPGTTDNTNYSYTAKIYVDSSKPINDDGAGKLGWDRINSKSR